MRKRNAASFVPARTAGLMMLATGIAFLTGGCSTPGPLHLYSLAPASPEIHDSALGSGDRAQEVPSFLEPTDTVVGFAYDPFTDHFFLRLAPGHRIRVVDRPARKIKREFEVPELSSSVGGDLAVSPRDGHLFFGSPTTTEVQETSRLGEFIRIIPLSGRTAGIAAIAYDGSQRELLVLDPAGRSIERFDLDGQKRSRLSLAQTVQPSLAYDSDAHELYAPLVEDAGAVGVFDADGRLRRRIPLPAGQRSPLVDVGPHSFLRVF